MEKVKLVADMTGDLFQSGHVNFLKNAKLQFVPREVHLTVALQTDEQVFSYKGKYPVMDFDCRKEILTSCRFVDSVIEAPNLFNKQFIEQFDYLVHGDDIKNWEQSLVVYYYSEAIKVKKLLLIPYTKGISSTQLKEIAKKI